MGEHWGIFVATELFVRPHTGRPQPTRQPRPPIRPSPRSAYTCLRCRAVSDGARCAVGRTAGGGGGVGPYTGTAEAVLGAALYCRAPCAFCGLFSANDSRSWGVDRLNRLHKAAELQTAPESTDKPIQPPDERKRIPYRDFRGNGGLSWKTEMNNRPNAVLCK